MYMDRIHVAQHNVKSVYDMGLSLFHTHVAMYVPNRRTPIYPCFFLMRRHDQIHSRLVNTLLTSVQKERTGEMVNKGLLKNVTHMLVDLGIRSRSVYEDCT